MSYDGGGGGGGGGGNGGGGEVDNSMTLGFNSVGDGISMYKPMMSLPLTTSDGSSLNFQQHPPPHSHGLSVGVGGGGGGGGVPHSFQPRMEEVNLNNRHNDNGININNNADINNSNAGEFVPSLKRKRGRPRKYSIDNEDANANGIHQHLFNATPTTTPSPPPRLQSQQQQQQQQSPAWNGSLAPSQKRGRGRPPGSTSRKQQLHHCNTEFNGNIAHGSARGGFAPHVITVKAGEDVLAKIMSFSQHGPRTVCILSANGAISNVTLRQGATSVTYEGRYEILSLSGSFLLSDIGGQRSRTGGLSVALAGPDGHVLGGGVAGLLIAASSVQVIAASFILDGWKDESKMRNRFDSLSAPLRLVPGTSRDGTPPMGGPNSESLGLMTSLNHSGTGCNNNESQGLGSMHWK